MSIDWLLERVEPWRDKEAVVWRDKAFTYGDILAEVAAWRERLDAEAVRRGQVVTLRGDYSPKSCALLLALIERGAIVVPLTAAAETQREEFLKIAEVEVVISFDDADQWDVARRDVKPQNPLTRRLIEQGRPGLVLFSSGSTGKSKAALHDFTALLDKFKTLRTPMRALTFLLLDHIGGINTLLYTLSNGGAAVSVQSRDPEEICRSIERHRVELLPTSPTFLNMLFMGEAFSRHDLSSLKLVTYGTEVMAQSTLEKISSVLPGVRFLQTYGLTELGILRSKSKESGSLWVKVGGEGFETKVVDGTLRVRAKSAMLGYLNAPSPFDADGWMNTEDVVETDGEYIRILGRRTDIINVGGQKVYPAEVESVLLRMDNVLEAAVYAEKNPIVGHIVVARLNLSAPEDPDALKTRMRLFCKGKLAPFKIPAKLEVTDKRQHGARYKKIRG